MRAFDEDARLGVLATATVLAGLPQPAEERAVRDAYAIERHGGAGLLLTHESASLPRERVALRLDEVREGGRLEAGWYRIESHG
ncbi:MAG: hypothetical protein JWO86_1919 [Myxococcaceae bacterium]|nr:hypothetical protein [Myxococcaceae bacterium]